MQANVSNVCVVYKYATRFRECISGMYLELEQEQQLEFQKTEISKQQIVHFSTNNLRQFTTSMTEYLCSKDPDALRKWKFFASVLLCFHFGVIVSYLSCKNFGHTGSLVCFLPVFSGFCLVWTRKHFVAVKHFVYNYLITPKKSSAYTTESE